MEIHYSEVSRLTKMLQVKFLIVSLLVFDLKEIDGKVFRGQFNLEYLYLKHFAGKCVDFLLQNQRILQ